MDGEHIVEATVRIAVAPGWHGHDFDRERIASAVESAIAHAEGLALVDDEAVTP
ncbi:hypothetical protein [Amycolatopsis sp. NPDC001370]